MGAWCVAPAVRDTQVDTDSGSCRQLLDTNTLRHEVDTGRIVHAEFGQYQDNLRFVISAVDDELQLAIVACEPLAQDLGVVAFRSVARSWCRPVPMSAAWATVK